MARDRITLRVDEDLRARIEAVREHLATDARPGQRAPTLSDAARHCIELGLAGVESAAPVPPRTQAPATAPPTPTAPVNPPPAAAPLAPPTPTRSWVDDFDDDDD